MNTKIYCVNTVYFETMKTVKFSFNSLR